MKNKIKNIIFIMAIIGLATNEGACVTAPCRILINSNVIKNNAKMKEIELVNSEKRALVDDEDFGFLNRFKWRLSYGGYCVRHDNRTMHVLIMGTENSPKQIDHKNRVKTDNQKSNLRIATATQNSVNREPKVKGKYKGVTCLGELRKRKNKEGKYYHAIRKKRYRAVLRHSGINYSLGVYYTPEEAAIAYDKKAYEIHGEYAYINLPDKLIKE